MFVRHAQAPDGCWVLVSGRPLRDESGQLKGGVALCRDVTDRKLAEELLRQTATRERAVALVLQRMRETLDLTTIFHTTTVEVRQAVQCDRTLIYRFNADWSGQVVAESVADGWKPIIPVQLANSELNQVLVEQANCIIKQLNGTEVLLRDTYLQEQEGGLYRQKSNYCCVTDIYQQEF
jgi:hypothetical protein